jgi:hypothetical protein
MAEARIGRWVEVEEWVNMAGPKFSFSLMDVVTRRF